jgi:6-phosphogluconolactonase (cycloisomerase 2 family)
MRPRNTAALGLAALWAVLAASCGGGGGGSIAAPQSLSYSGLPSALSTCQALAERTPTVAGGAPERFEVSPPLPEGLVLDPASGALRGSALAAAPQTAYTITASNSGGAASTVVEFEVRASTPSGPDYGGSSVPLAIGVDARLAPQLASGLASQWELVAGALPLGVELDADTGELRGVAAATELDTLRSVTVRASDCLGAFADVEFVLQVTWPVAQTAVVINEDEPVLSTYLVQSGTGSLAAFEHSLGDDTAASEVCALDDGRCVVIAEGDFASVRSYLRDEQGRWVPSGSHAPTGASPAIGLATRGDHLYALTAEPRLLAWRIDSATGAFESVGEETELPREPTALALHPSGRFAFVAGAFDADLAVVTLDPSGGLPSAGPRLEAAGALASLAVSRDGAFLLGADLAAGVRVYSIHPASGALAEVAGSPTATGSGAGALWLHPRADLVVAARSFEGFLDGFALTQGGALLALPSSPFALERAASRLCGAPDGEALFAAIQSDGWLAFGVDETSGLRPLRSPRTLARVGARSLALVPGSKPLRRVGRELFLAGSAQPLTCSIKSDGKLVPVAAVESAGAPTTWVEPHPWLPLAYVGRAGADASIADVLDDGTLVERGPASGGVTSGGLRIDPSGRFGYEWTTQPSVALRARSIGSDGALSDAGELSLEGAPTALVFHPSGEFVYVAHSDSIATFAIDWASGALVEWGELILGDTPAALAVDPSGTLLAALSFDGATVSLYALDALTGLPSALPAGPVALGGTALALAFDAYGEHLVCSGGAGARLNAWSVDRTSGSLSLRFTTPGSDPVAFCAAPDGRNYYAALAQGTVANYVWSESLGFTFVENIDVGATVGALALRSVAR